MAKAQNIAQNFFMRANNEEPKYCTALSMQPWPPRDWPFVPQMAARCDSMLNAQIGMLLFQKAGVLMQTGQKTGLKAAYKAAIPYLEASQVTGAKAKLLQQLWPAWAMLAVAHYRTDGGIDSAVEVLENAVKVSPKSGLLWSLYAWLLYKSKRLDDAIGILAAAEKAEDDKHLRENFTLVQNRKPMKMRSYGEQWFNSGWRSHARQPLSLGWGIRECAATHDDADPVTPGTKLGRYTVLRRLGVGAWERFI